MKSEVEDEVEPELKPEVESEVESAAKPRKPGVRVVELRGYTENLRSSSKRLRVLFSHATPRY